MIARHLFPTGTGVTATHALSISSGIPSPRPVSKSAISRSSVISRSSAYMHLSAHLLGLLGCEVDLLACPLFFRLFLPRFFPNATGTLGNSSSSLARPGEADTPDGCGGLEGVESRVEVFESIDAYWATPSRTGSTVSSPSSSEGPKLRSAKKSNWRLESNRSARRYRFRLIDALRGDHEEDVHVSVLPEPVEDAWSKW